VGSNAGIDGILQPIEEGGKLRNAVLDLSKATNTLDQCLLDQLQCQLIRGQGRNFLLGL